MNWLPRSILIEANTTEEAFVTTDYNDRLPASQFQSSLPVLRDGGGGRAAAARVRGIEPEERERGG